MTAATPSTARPFVRTDRKGRVAGFALMILCVLACTAPVIGGLLAGPFLDHVLDSPVWIAVMVMVGIGVAAIVAVLRRRNRGCGDGC